MLNGDGLSGVMVAEAVEHKCEGCHNPQPGILTEDCLSEKMKKSEIFTEL